LVAVGPFVLSGQLKGDGRIDGPLNIAATAHWEGDVEATQAVVTGRVTGRLKVAGKLEIGKAAVIRGSVEAQTIAIARGAVVDGDIRVTGQAPIVRFEEKRE
jgi:cytoskeletal protein CcmA (bactofilin family)